MKITRNVPDGVLLPGFTLLELLLVIAVLALLSAVAISSIAGVLRQAAVLRAKSELAVLALALEEHKRRHGDYPRTDGPNAVLDPWGNRYLYVYRSASASAAASFLLLSAGPDGATTWPDASGRSPDASDDRNADNVCWETGR